MVSYRLETTLGREHGSFKFISVLNIFTHSFLDQKGSKVWDDAQAGGQRKKLRLQLEVVPIVENDPEGIDSVVESVVGALTDTVEALLLEETIKEEQDLTRFVGQTVVCDICQ